MSALGGGMRGFGTYGHIDRGGVSTFSSNAVHERDADPGSAQAACPLLLALNHYAIVWFGHGRDISFVRGTCCPHLQRYNTNKRFRVASSDGCYLAHLEQFVVAGFIIRQKYCLA